MIVVKVELHSAITGKVSEIARMVICNNGTSRSKNIGNYSCVALRGRSAEVFDRDMRTGKAWGMNRKIVEVNDYPRLRVHVWNLVRRALEALEYNK